MNKHKTVQNRYNFAAKVRHLSCLSASIYSLTPLDNSQNCISVEREGLSTADCCENRKKEDVNLKAGAN